MHATLCSILSDAVEGGFLSHSPAWRTYRYAGRKCEKKIADEETAQRIIAALEGESIKYETYFKLIIATGMRRGECCGLKWCDIDWEQRSIHICRNAVKVTDEEIFVKEPKTRAGDRYVYFSAEMESLLREYRQECVYITKTYDQRELTADDFLFRRQGAQLPMTPTTFTYRFKLILKKNGLPQELNVHSLRHTAASLMIAGGTDVATVAGILGHSQPSTTLDIYTHAFDKNKKAASAGLQEMNSRNDYRHFIIIRVARFIHRQRYVKCICILCIEIMAVIELPIMGRFVNCCCNKYRCVFRQILRMYDCDMIITAINIISIFRRTEHINRCSVLLEHLDLIADIRRNAF